MEGGLADDGELVCSHGQAAPLFEPVDASFDRIALLVCLGVESGRAATETTSPQPVTDLAGWLRDDCAGPAPMEVAPDCAGRIRVICQDGIGSGPGSSRPASGNTNAIQDGHESRRVARLACGDAQDHGPRTAVAGEVDFCALAAVGASECLMVGFRPAGRPLFLAPAACWWARQTVESTDTVQSMSSASSASARTAVQIRSQVPSAAHLIRRL